MTSTAGVPWAMSEDALSALSHITRMACDTVPGCVTAGLTMVRGIDAETVMATDEPARALDAAQYRLGVGPCLEAIRIGSPVLVTDLCTDRRWPGLGDDAIASGLRSVLSLPLAADGHRFGALNLYAPDAEVFDADSHQPGLAIARQGAVTLRYLQLFHNEQAARSREHDVAATLQHDLLPEITDVDGVTAASRYLASGDAAQVGGDWYDLLALPDGSVGLAIGDVMGHGVDAAVAMGQLRSVLRSYAWECHDPATVLDRLDLLVHGLDMARITTAVYARLALDPVHGARLTYSNAGHPPPLVHEPGGSVRLLTSGHSPLIGAPLPHPKARPQATECLSPGTTLLFYTDGLVERRQEQLDESLELLRKVTAEHDSADGPGALCDALTGKLAASAEDDVALLAVQVPSGDVHRDTG